MTARRQKVSAFVVSFNRAALIGTCLRALSFADEIVVVDKSSTDDTASIAARHADRVITVPWTPTADDTRSFALSQCAHDWIVFADDDEVFSPEAVRFIDAELCAPRADIYEFPRREYILGVHDERAYYWPEHHIRLFRRGAVAFSPTVHACVVPCSDRVLRVPAATEACIHHLSHQDVAQWLEKTNRYTSCLDRARVAHAGHDLADFAHARIDHWLDRSRDPTAGGYPQAVALLRATYDLIDRLKTWEQERGLDAAAAFGRVCAELDAAHGALPERAGERCEAAPVVEAAISVEVVLRASLRGLRSQFDAEIAAAATHAAAREAALVQELAAAQAARHASEALATAALTAAAARAEAASGQAAAAAAALCAIETSTFWRATAWPRRVAGRLRARR
jgi:O-antigen biosynthesis protein